MRTVILKLTGASLMVVLISSALVAADIEVSADVKVTEDALTVDGVVESTDGGFKFPDGTVQLTASAPTWHQLLTTDRFQLVMNDEAVLDRETGLVWDKSPATSVNDWTSALTQCYNRLVGGRLGWRLPTVEEISTLIEKNNSSPALPTNHPFTDIQATNGLDRYWTISTTAWKTDHAWFVTFSNGTLNSAVKSTTTHYHWCVRGGKGYDSY